MKMKLHVLEISSLFLFVFEHRNMKCMTCKGKYDGDAGACKQCYEDLKAKVALLTMPHQFSISFAPDLSLFACDDGHPDGPVQVSAHTVVLVSAHFSNLLLYFSSDFCSNILVALLLIIISRSSLDIWQTFDYMDGVVMLCGL